MSWWIILLITIGGAGIVTSPLWFVDVVVWCRDRKPYKRHHKEIGTIRIIEKLDGGGKEYYIVLRFGYGYPSVSKPLSWGPMGFLDANTA